MQKRNRPRMKPREKIPKALNIVAVDGVVGPVPRVHPVGNRHRAVGRHIETKNELFQIRTVVLRVTARDSGRSFGTSILSTEGDGSRVVVNP